MPGTKHACSSSHCGLPPDCACRCTTGLHPPDMATRSQAILVTGLGNGGAVRVERHHVDAPRRARAADVDDDGVGDHLDAGLAHALGQLAARRADASRRPQPLRCPPARAGARVRYALSLLVNTTARVPGCTP